MKYFSKTSLSLWLFFFFLISIPAFSQNAILIKNTNVITVSTDKVLKNTDVLIENGIIRKIGNKIPANTAYLVLDGKGKFLMPSLADMHSHIPLKSDKKLTTKHYLLLQLAAGVTTLRSMRGNYEHLSLRDSVQKEYILSPNLVLSAPPITRQTKTNINTDSLVQKYKADGFDFIKILSIPSKDFYKKIQESALKAGLKVVGHLPAGDIDLALQYKQYSIEHLQGYTDYYEKGLSSELEKLLDLTIQNNVYNCPTMDWTFVGSLYYPLQQLKERIGMDFLPELLKSSWEKTLVDYIKTVKPDEAKKDSLHLISVQNIMQKMRDKKYKLILSPDASGIFQVPGFGLVEEMKLFKKFGFSNYEILKIATINASEYFGESDKSGFVKENYNANLILLNGNPLENIENISKIDGVILNGKWYSENSLKDQLKQNLK